MARSTCSVADCSKPSVARTLCMRHYQAARKDDPDAPRCSEAGCARAVKAKRLCAYHYQKARLTRPVDADDERCGVEGCARPRWANGLCILHDRRKRAGRAVEAPVRLHGATPLDRIVAMSVRAPGGCLVFNGSGAAVGQGYAWDGATPRLVHRTVYELTHRVKIPRRIHVHHACVNPICVEVDHLMLATPAVHKLLHRMIAAGASIDEQRATATFYADHPDSFNALDHA